MRMVLSLCAAAIAALGAFLLWSAIDPARIRTVDPSPATDASTDSDIGIFWPSIHDPQGFEPSGVAVGPDGSVYILHRAGRPFGGDRTPISDPVIIKLNAQTGEVIARFGEGLFAAPHGLSVAEDGSIWVADIALNSVTRLDADGRLVRQYGDAYPFYLEALLRIRNVFPRLPLPMSEATFARPTDVALLSGERFAVTDGYRNSRLAVFGYDGTLLWQIDRRGSEPGYFHLPHGLAADDNGNLYVADRRNARIQVFSDNGRFLRVIENATVGRPFGLEVGPGNCLYVADGGDSLDGGGSNRVGIGMLTLQGSPILRMGKTGAETDSFSLPHDIAVSPSGHAYVADVQAKRVQVVDLSGRCKK